MYQDMLRGHEPGTWSTHSCDGCCMVDEWRIFDLLDGLIIAHLNFLGPRGDRA